MKYNIDNVAKAMGLVSGAIEDEYKQIVPDATESPEYQVVLVWFAYILGGYKALVFCPEHPGRYYEVTYNVAKKEHYIDIYQKTRNIAVADGPLKAPLN